MKIKTKVILFFGIFSITLVALMIAYLQYFVRASFQDEVMGNLHVMEEKNMGVYGAFIEGLKVRTLNWSSDNYIKDIAGRIVDPTLSASRHQAAVDEFGEYLRTKKMIYDPTVLIADILDQNGIVIASSRTERIGTDEHKEEIEHKSHYFSKTITAKFGEVFARSVVFEDDETSEPMFHLTTRLFRTNLDAQGRPIALPEVLLVHFVALPQLTGFLTRSADTPIVPPETGSYSSVRKLKTLETYVVNKDRLIVTPTHSISDTAKKQRITTKPVEECFTNGREIAEEYFDYRGVPVVGVSSCLAEDGLVIVNEMEVSEAYATLNGLLLKTLVVGGAMFLAVILFTFLIVGRFLRSIESITSIAKWVTLGNFSDRAPVTSKDELGILSGTLNLMLDKIESSQKAVKQSEEHLRRDAEELRKTVKEKEEQTVFMEQSKRAIQNLLEDAEETKNHLATESTRLQAILRSVGDGLILIDKQYKIELINPKTAELFAMDPLDLMGEDLRTVMKILKKKKGELPLAEWPIEEMFMTKQIVTTDLDDDLSITTEKHTEELPVAFSIAPLEGEEGVAGAVIIIRDITEDRALDDAKSGFISVASHQLRTPLTTIRWYSEMLLSEDVGAVSDAQRDFLKEIHGGAERLYQTIDLLLGLSRVESGKVKSEPVPINLGLFSEEIAHELGPQAQMKNLSLKVLPPEGQVVVSLDMLTLRQVILNLLSNAIRYTNEGGVIEARWWVGADGKEVTYSVHDNGIGIPEAQKSRIFSKFFRAENALEKVPDGSGLGLALVKELVEAWGGKVWFESPEGQGTTFFFTVPLEGKTFEH